jgi:UDP-glucose:(heptosyl)LPS alpha-1,3-glucosyltransferase
MGAADLFLFPSWYEAFSLATIEAAACGLPIVASKINGSEDFIHPGVNGEFIEHDPEKIAGVLCSLVSNKARLIEMGLSARSDVEKNYTWERVAQMTEDAYAEYLGS